MTQNISKNSQKQQKNIVGDMAHFKKKQNSNMFKIVCMLPHFAGLGWFLGRPGQRASAVFGQMQPFGGETPHRAGTWPRGLDPYCRGAR